MSCIIDDFYLNFGWEHIWCDPGRYVFPKEYVKGPFSNAKLAFPLPYVSLCQTEGELLRIRTGIPDCWADYLIHQLAGDYDSMHKEDVDIAHNLMKDCRIYLGQGIPNPLITSYIPHSGELSCKGLKDNLRKYLFQLSDYKNKNRKVNCHCCEKNYLLECPDKNAKNRNCTCKTCHSKDTDSGDQCKCIEIIQNWVSENLHLKESQRSGGRKKQAKSRGSSSESSRCETDDEGTNQSGKKLLCPKNYRMAFGSISSANSNVSCIERQSKHEYVFSKDFLYRGYTENERGFVFFPYTRNFYRRNKRLKFKDVKAVSKQIQTESQLIGDTKTVQTENLESKIQTSNKCFRCSMYQCPQMICKINPFGKTVCVCPAIIKNHAFICPYTCRDHSPDQKLHGVSSFEKRQKKKKEAPKDANSGGYPRRSKLDDNMDTYKVSDCFKSSENSPQINETGGHYQPCLRKFDNLKYLTDSRLKSYLRERETLRRFHYKTSQPLNEATKQSSVFGEGHKPENFKLMPNKTNISDSYSDSLRVTGTYTICPKSVDRGVMTGAGEGTYKKEIITKYFKNMIDSDESRTYGLLRSRESNKKVRKLVGSRKKKKTGARKKMDNRPPKLVNKNTQVEKGECGRHFWGDDKESRNKFLGYNFKLKQMDDASKQSEQGVLVELFKRPLRSEHYSEVLERTPHGRTRRSSDVMKFIVGDLLTDEKSKT